IFDWNYGYFSRAGTVRVRTDSDQHLLTGRSLEETADVDCGFHVSPINGQKVLIHSYVYSRLRQRRLQFPIPVLSVIDWTEAISILIHRVIGAQQPALYPFRFRDVAATHEHMPNGDLAQHFFEQVVQVISARDTSEIRFVILLYRFQIQPVQAGIVKEVAFVSPDLVVHVLPLRERVYVDFNLVELQR